jgi:hypothetical protein
VKLIGFMLVAQLILLEIQPKEGTNNDLASQTKEETSPSKTVVDVDRTIEGHVLISSEGKDCLSAEWKRRLWKSCVYMITLGMLIAMLLGLNMSWTAISAALALVVLDFKDARPSLEKVLKNYEHLATIIFVLVED